MEYDWHVWGFRCAITHNHYFAPTCTVTTFYMLKFVYFFVFWIRNNEHINWNIWLHCKLISWWKVAFLKFWIPIKAIGRRFSSFPCCLITCWLDINFYACLRDSSIDFCQQTPLDWKLLLRKITVLCAPIWYFTWNIYSLRLS